MSKYEIITLILTILGILIAIGGIIIAIIAIYHNVYINKLKHKWEKEEGAYDKPKLDLKILWGGTTNNLCFYFPFSELGIVWVPIFIQISNLGSKIAKNIELIVHCSKALLPDIEKVDASFKRTFGELKFEKLEETEQLVTYGFKFPKLREKGIYQLDLKFPIFGDTVNNTRTFTANTLDGSVDITYGFEYSYVIEFWLNSDDQASIIRKYNLQIFNSSNYTLKEYLIKKSLYLNEEYKNKLKNLSWMNKIHFYFFDRLKYFQNGIRNLSFITSHDLVEIGDSHLEYEAKSLAISNGSILIDGFILFPSMDIMGNAKQIKEGTYLKRIKNGRVV